MRCARWVGLVIGLAVLVMSAVAQQDSSPWSPETLAQMQQLQQAALADDYAYPRRPQRPDLLCGLRGLSGFMFCYMFLPIAKYV